VDARGTVYHTYRTTVVVHSTAGWMAAASEPGNGQYLVQVVRTTSLILVVAHKTGWPWKKGSLQAWEPVDAMERSPHVMETIPQHSENAVADMTHSENYAEAGEWQTVGTIRSWT